MTVLRYDHWILFRPVYRSALATHTHTHTRVFIGRVRMSLADIIEELRRISRRLHRAQPSIIRRWNSPFFPSFFPLFCMVVNNARCGASSIHHDKTLQMNIDNSLCLFLTIIYNGMRYYLQMITQRAPRASEPYPDYWSGVRIYSVKKFEKRKIKKNIHFSW